jgi:hypothetical protein
LSGRQSNFINTKQYLALVYDNIKTYGWVPKEGVGKPTYERALEDYNNGVKPSARGIVEANAVIAGVNNWEKGKTTLYLKNLITKKEFVDKRAPFVAWSINMNENFKDDEDTIGRWLEGEVGDRVKIIATCESSRSYTTKYGVHYVNILTDTSGSELRWYTARRLVPGRVYVGTAEIKKKAIYQKKRTTNISNFRIKEV